MYKTCPKRYKNVTRRHEHRNKKGLNICWIIIRKVFYAVGQRTIIFGCLIVLHIPNETHLRHNGRKSSCYLIAIRINAQFFHGELNGLFTYMILLHSV